MGSWRFLKEPVGLEHFKGKHCQFPFGSGHPNCVYAARYAGNIAAAAVCFFKLYARYDIYGPLWSRPDLLFHRNPAVLAVCDVGNFKANLARGCQAPVRTGRLSYG